eukprot:SAG31_NODE_6406_length_2031_cov_1.235507_1_plen_295_part_00
MWLTLAQAWPPAEAEEEHVGSRSGGAMDAMDVPGPGDDPDETVNPALATRKQALEPPPASSSTTEEDEEEEHFFDADGHDLMDESAIATLARKVSAELSLSPPNLHQATTHFVLDSGASLPTKLKFLCGSYLLVMTQLFVLNAVLVGVIRPSCTYNSQCQGFSAAKQFCAVRQGYCRFCALMYTIEDDGNTLVYSEDFAYFFNRQYHEENLTDIRSPHFACPPGDNVCEACYEPATRSFDTVDDDLTAHGHLHAMAFGDWVTLFLASFVVAIQVASELRDIFLWAVPGPSLSTC